MNSLKRLVNLSIFVLCATFCIGQSVPVQVTPIPQFQAFDQNGRPLAFGCVFTYTSGTTNPLATYSDYTGTIQNSNPVTLSASGSANIWLQAGQAYTLVVKSNGGTDCSLGTLMYSVDGVGTGTTQQTTIVIPTSGTATFADQSQNQLFTLFLTSNVVGQPISAVGVIPPGIITFQITQDAVGSRTFSWPANTVNPATICSTANCVTTQTFIWNGTNATAIGAATYSIGPASALSNLFDFGLSASSPVCTSSTFELTSTCAAVLSVTYNGQTVAPAGSGNVNAGAAVHSVALNEAAGAAIAGLVLANNQIAVGQTSADPVGSTLPTCAGGSFLSFSGTLPVTCIPVVGTQSYVRKELSGDVAVTVNILTTLATQAVTMPASGCPCRASVSWSLGFTTGSSGTYTAGVNDGTNTFAVALANTTGSVGGGAEAGISGSGVSHITYANSAVVTFTLKTESTDAGYTVKQAMNNIVQNSGMDIVIQTSN